MQMKYTPQFRRANTNFFQDFIEMSSQTPHEVFMVKPKNFGFDFEAAQSNVFQKESDLNPADLKAKVTQVRSI